MQTRALETRAKRPDRTFYPTLILSALLLMLMAAGCALPGTQTQTGAFASHEITEGDEEQTTLTGGPYRPLDADEATDPLIEDEP